MPRLYRDMTAVELRAEERALDSVLRTGTLPGSNVRALVDPAVARARLTEVRQAIGPRAVLHG